ncbi:MAG: molybdopterin-dependent oxidoreductase [Candidatus Hodarchaeota archaeon]
MEKRNFNLLIASMCIGISLFWLFMYSYVILDIDPLQNNITIKGKVRTEIELKLSDLKSTKYLQIKDRTFHIVNAIGREYDLVFSGVSLWSIFEVENILEEDASTFLFIGGDGYYAETPLAIQLAQDYPNQIILAYEQDGQPLFYDGPIRSVVDHEVIPEKANTHYAIKDLKTILIQ